MKVFLGLVVTTVVFVSNVQADLSKIERVLQKEPAYQTGSPKYCLAVFGADMKTRVWLVRDGGVLFVDRNGNGDLTEKGEKIPAKKTGGKGVFNFDVGDVGNAPRVHKAMNLQVLKEGSGLSVQVAMPNFKGNGVGGRVSQLTEWLKFADKPGDAPVVHFGGPLQIMLNGEHKLTAGRVNDVYLCVGTPGLGAKANVYVDYEELIPQTAHPSVEIVYPSETAGDPPIRELYELRDRC